MLQAHVRLKREQVRLGVEILDRLPRRLTQQHDRVCRLVDRFND